MRDTERKQDAVQTSDQRWVAQAAAGDERAFRELYRSYVRPVYWIAHGIVGSAPDAEDVTQETFVTAWRKLPGLDLQGDSALPWLATICRFQAANRLRRRRRDQAHTADGVDETLPATVNVEEQVITAALADRIVEEVGTLSELDRAIFRLCAAEGYGYQAAADQLGISHAVVRNRLSRVRTRLRSAVQEASDA
ncbi:RNA polymerase sigma factor [Microbacterium hydrocarbonoxydans]|uniref:RNA polymerase sigma factor n=1 Tax=Microbacterium hydrocarbonoxydans TaxID=273678 RepID=UPI00203EB106|nr:sigma-70 family RNA polymerase sigma factor [Microbacterium hydrocarbonoxydans]MCM3779052.1 sigma-70 family RNA polymerase sigma factor [Microbacterium hydrocarbonoxydans]